jgi:ribulose-bisphosphate carboxylase large chain
MERLRVTYHLDVDAAEAEERAEAVALEQAEAVALEQTVEVPRPAVRAPFLEKEVVGSVEALERDPAGGWRTTIGYPVETTAFDPAQLLNVVFGNSSLHEDIRCLDLELPTALLEALQGPRFGIEGLRRVVGVADRPLTCTAVKPMGLSSEALAEMCRTFARAGIDVIKDDHGLADQSFSRFQERVVACLAAAREVAEETGHHAVYVPNLIGTPGRVTRGLRFAVERGARAVLVSPMLIGLPAFWELCQQRASVPVLAHPAFGGVLRIASEALFGKLYRLFGADAVIYVNFASRFRRSPDACRELAERLLRPWGDLRTGHDAPGGRQPPGGRRRAPGTQPPLRRGGPRGRRAAVPAICTGRPRPRLVPRRAGGLERARRPVGPFSIVSP